MTSARHLIEVLSQVGGCSSVCDSGDYGDYSPSAEGRFARNMLERRQAVLATTIETEIIPRLMLAHRESPDLARSRRSTRRSFEKSEIIEFARLVVVHDVSVASAYVDAVVKQGASLELVFTKLFTPAARYLGEQWDEDRCTFSDVTIGLARIQQLVHELSPFFEAESAPIPQAKSALLAPLPGEQHSLGILMVEEFFRRAGWDVWVPLGISQSDLLTLASQERFDVVGFSVSGEGLLDRIASGIQDVRKVSANPDIAVMVGGRFFNEHPEYVAQVGADATDLDGSQAVVRLEGLSPRLRSV
jgi:MerR family transcriptional regulator, light-induced transcriptional regulator